MLVRSPTMTKFVSGRIDQRLRAAEVRPARAGRAPARGGTPSTASAMAAIQSGVVPQQPPTMLSQPLRANSPSAPAMWSRVAVEAAEAVGHAGVGIAADRASAQIAARLSTCGRIRSTPTAQLRPTLRASKCETET